MNGSDDDEAAQQHRASDVGKRPEGIPGIGVRGAAAIAATVTGPRKFKAGRGLTEGVPTPPGGV